MTVLAEMFFDPQSHTSRGVGFDTFLAGFHSAMKARFQRPHLLPSRYIHDCPRPDALASICFHFQIAHVVIDTVFHMQIRSQRKFQLPT